MRTPAQAAQVAKTRAAILSLVADWHDIGGADTDSVAAAIGRNRSHARRYMQGLVADGLVARQGSGPGTRYFLAGRGHPRVWLVVVDDAGTEHGRLELPERFLDDDGASDRRMRPISKWIQRTMREARNY